MEPDHDGFEIGNHSMLCRSHDASAIVVQEIPLTIQDAKGKYFGAELKVKANNPGEGWVSYAWPNPKTKVVEDKCTYLKTTTMEGKKVMVCAGIGGIPVQDCK